ncbi:unnamed protein product [Prunus armeniaca]
MTAPLRIPSSDGGNEECGHGVVIPVVREAIGNIDNEYVKKLQKQGTHRSKYVDLCTLGSCRNSRIKNQSPVYSESMIQSLRKMLTFQSCDRERSYHSIKTKLSKLVK